MSADDPHKLDEKDSKKKPPRVSPKEGLDYKFTADGQLRVPMEVPANAEYWPLWKRQLDGFSPAPEWMTWAKPWKGSGEC